MVKEQTESFGITSGKVRSESDRSMPGIIGAIISWILNRVKEVVGWVLQNLWALFVGVGGLLYVYMVMRK